MPYPSTCATRRGSLVACKIKPSCPFSHVKPCGAGSIIFQDDEQRQEGPRLESNSQGLEALLAKEGVNDKVDLTELIEIEQVAATDDGVQQTDT